ncbi:unnamed protein product [Arabis nemorensis]|uniref:Uncharacterized protein n=1 Tax=Arabis nemorensis TaxID=586526 RepID=A0A565C3Z9_9BRAS|nr:unnamed protein product [Arabis nemorensis]
MPWLTSSIDHLINVMSSSNAPRLINASPRLIGINALPRRRRSPKFDASPHCHHITSSSSRHLVAVASPRG